MIERLAPRWRLLESAPADGALNMAVDAALLDVARRNAVGTLRLYGWSRPTLSFGRNERTRDRFDASTLVRHGVDAVRRPTGGRSLLHHREVTYSVTAPVGALSLAESYRAINALLQRALQRLGAVARVAERSGPALRPDGAACFAQPSAGELVVEGAKLVGSAQLREAGAFLQHGSILLDDDQSDIGRLRTAHADRIDPALRVATLRGILGRPIAAAEVVTAIGMELAAELSCDVTSLRSAESDEGISVSVAAHRAHFADPAWTWRR